MHMPCVCAWRCVQGLWRRLIEQATRRMSTFTPPNIVNFTWALAKRSIADVPVHAVRGPPPSGAAAALSCVPLQLARKTQLEDVRERCLGAS